MNQLKNRLNRLDGGKANDGFDQLTDEELTERINETSRKLVQKGVPQSLINDANKALSKGVIATEAFKPIKEFVEQMEAQP